MKKLKIILPISLAMLFILAACSAPVAEVEEKTSVDSDTAQETAPDVEVVLDTDPFASRYGSGLKCSQLKGEDKRQICESQINDVIGNMLEQEIISSFDTNRCKELPGEIAENCQNSLAETGVTGPVSSEEIAIFNETIQGTFPEPGEDDGAGLFFPEYDSAKCANLKTAGYKEYCEKLIAQQLEQVKFDQIIQSGDVSRCDELADDQIDQCKIFLGEVIFEGTPDQEAFEGAVPPGAIVEPGVEAIPPEAVLAPGDELISPEDAPEPIEEPISPESDSIPGEGSAPPETE